MSTRAELLGAWSPLEGAARARELFVRAFGKEPAGVWSAPGRLNVIGEHVDYNAGPCLPLALAHRTFVALGPGTSRTARVVSAQENGGPRTVALDGVGRAGTSGGVQGWPAYVVGTWWAMDRDGLLGDVSGFDVAVDSCVPYGAGLSSSAALEAAVAVALDDLWSTVPGAVDDAHRARIAAACVHGENEVAGAPTGGMDQAASLRARAGHALLLDSRDGSVDHVPLDLAAASLTLLVIDTRAEHRLVDGQYARRRQVCDEAAAALGVASLREVADAHVRGEVDLDDVLALLPTEEQRRRVRHVVTEIDRVGAVAARLRQEPELRGWTLAAVGQALDDSNTSLRDDYEVSCPELDVAVAAARSAGAHGARMTGGGFGGSANRARRHRGRRGHHGGGGPGVRRRGPAATPVPHSGRLPSGGKNPMTEHPQDSLTFRTQTHLFAQLSSCRRGRRRDTSTANWSPGPARTGHAYPIAWLGKA